MYHYKFVLALFLGFFAVSCKERCSSENLARMPLDQLIKEYFGSYKAGSYWVYQAQDSSKTDSVYVTSYSHLWERANTLCREKEIIKLRYNSQNKFILTSGFCCVEIKDGLANFNACPNSTLFYDIDGIGVYENKLFERSHICTPVSSVTLNGVTHTGEIWKITLLQISKQGDVYIKKNLGIVGWSTTSDTFSLIKQNIIL